MRNSARSRFLRSKQAFFGLAALAMLVCLSGAPAHAQSKVQVFGGYSYNSSGTSLTSCLFVDVCTLTSSNQGYAASLAYSFSPHFALEAAFAGYDGTTTPYAYAPGTEDPGESVKDAASKYFYTFGPRLSYPLGDFSLYSHFLVGGAHVRDNITETCIQSSSSYTCGSPNPVTMSDSGNGVAFKLGGGVDWNHGAWGIRILELDFVRTQISTSGTTNDVAYQPTFSTTGPNNMLQLAVGATFNFGSTSK
jgi:hypothetical protein